MVALTNGNYVVCSPWVENGTVAQAGAATWGDGHDGDHRDRLGGQQLGRQPGQ